MSSFVDSLNLRPQEKRILVGIGVAIFIVLNFVFVFPHFHDWSKINADLRTTRETITNYTLKIAQDNAPANGLKAQIAILEKQEEGGIATNETAIALDRSVTLEARACGFTPQSISPATTTKIGTANQSDKYFVSQSVVVDFQASEEALVKFLYDMGNLPAMIRVFSLQLNPADQNARYQLRARITLTADYQKTAETNAPPPPKPGTPPTVKAVGPATNANRGLVGPKANTPARANLPPVPGPTRRGPTPTMPAPPPARMNRNVPAGGISQ